MLNYKKDTSTLFFEIDGLFYRITHFFSKEDMNFRFKVTVTKMMGLEKEELTLNDVEDLFSFSYHHFNVRHRKELFNTKREQMIYERCFNGLLGHAYWMAAHVWDYRRSLGHTNKGIIKDYSNGCGRLAKHLKEQQS